MLSYQFLFHLLSIPLTGNFFLGCAIIIHIYVLSAQNDFQAHEAR